MNHNMVLVGWLITTTVLHVPLLLLEAFFAINVPHQLWMKLKPLICFVARCDMIFGVISLFLRINYCVSAST